MPGERIRRKLCIAAVAISCSSEPSSDDADDRGTTMGSSPSSGGEMVDSSADTTAASTASTSGQADTTGTSGTVPDVPEETGGIELPDPTPCKLVDELGVSLGLGIGLGFPLHPQRLPSVGTVRAKAVFVDFSDFPASMTPEAAFDMLSRGSETLFSEMSYGKFDYQLEPHLQWLRMSEPSTSYDFTAFLPHYDYVQEAIDLADPDVDFSDADHVVVVANPDATTLAFGPTLVTNDDFYALEADGVLIHNAITSANDLNFWGFKWLNHETGHSLGLPDLYSFAGGHPHVGQFDLMGNIAGESPSLLGYQRWLLDWVTDEQVYCQTTPEEMVELSPIETPDGVKLLVVPLSASRAVIVESRRAIGVDAAMPKEGALVYTVDAEVVTGEGPINVVSPDGVPFYDAPLLTGEAREIEGITVEVVDQGEDFDLVRVTAP